MAGDTAENRKKAVRGSALPKRQLTLNLYSRRKLIFTLLIYLSVQFCKPTSKWKELIYQQFTCAFKPNGDIWRVTVEAFSHKSWL
jgi:hypothetical protein